jgi:hypothetical protein
VERWDERKKEAPAGEWSPWWGRRGKRVGEGPTLNYKNAFVDFVLSCE